MTVYYSKLPIWKHQLRKDFLARELKRLCLVWVFLRLILSFIIAIVRVVAFWEFVVIVDFERNAL